MWLLNNIIQKTYLLWRFTRPHTFIGTLVSVGSLYTIALFYSHTAGGQAGIWVLTLIAALACNLFITGLNQWADVENDKINKPYLPIAAGELKRSTALRICLISLAISLGIGAAVSVFYFGLLALIAGIGAAYSLPPLKFKRHHFFAALSIVSVRGVLINLGFFNLYYSIFTGEYAVPAIIWALCILMIVFSIAIAWFKDIPDRAGDAVFAIKTLTLAYSPRFVFRAGSILVILAIGGTAFWAFNSADSALFPNLGYIQLGILGMFCGGVMLTKTNKIDSVKRFYLYFWFLFFIEYLGFAISLM